MAEKNEFLCLISEEQEINIEILRAENETRTRDPNLGKVMLYQLSYFRRIRSEEEETRTPTSQLTLPPQSSASTNSATSPFLKIIVIRDDAVQFGYTNKRSAT